MMPYVREFWLFFSIILLNLNKVNCFSLLGLNLGGESSAAEQGESYLESVNQPSNSYEANSNYQVGSNYQIPAPAAPKPSFSDLASISAYNPPSSVNVQQSNYNYQAQSNFPSYQQQQQSKTQQYQYQPQPAQNQMAGNSQPSSLLGLNLGYDEQAQKDHEAQAQKYREINENRANQYKQEQEKKLREETQRKALEQNERRRLGTGSGQQPKQAQSNVGSINNLFSNPTQTQWNPNPKSENKQNMGNRDKTDSGSSQSHSLLGLNLKYDEDDKKEYDNQAQKYRQINEDRASDLAQAKVKKEKENKAKEQAEIRRLEREQQLLLKRLDALEHNKDKSSNRGPGRRREDDDDDDKLADYEDDLRKSRKHGGSETQSRHGIGKSHMFDNPSPFVDRVLFRGKNDGTKVEFYDSVYLTILFMII